MKIQTQPEELRRQVGKANAPCETLYICYFGLREPLVQTQVLPYLRELQKDGIGINLLTFEPQLHQQWTAANLVAERKRLAESGIEWFYLPYHKRPSLPATLYDIAAGARLAARLVRERSITVLHARSHVGAAIGALTKRWSGRSGVHLVFDIRGFMPEEYTDAGRWQANGHLFKLTKGAERRLLAASDAFIVLTEKAREILFPGCVEQDGRGRPIEVIPCCVDFARFRNADRWTRDELRSELGIADRRVIIYVGALGGWYMTNEMVEFFAAAHRQNEKTFSVVLTQSEPELITDGLRRAGLSEQDYLVQRVAPTDVPRYLKAADVALSFIKPCFSKLSSSPTKIAEYLASGLPIVSTAGIGDLDEVIEGDLVGVTVKEHTTAAYMQALEAVDALRREGDLAARCRASAERRFDLEQVGGRKYRRLYARLLNGSIAPELLTKDQSASCEVSSQSSRETIKSASA